MAMASTTLAVVAGVAVLTVRKVYTSILALPPTKEMIKMIDTSECVVFRFIPALRGKIAWLPLIQGGASPVHQLAYVDVRSGRRVEGVQLKREDLLSPKYGGNKVRTLEFQLACAAVACEKQGGSLIALGAQGSNQVVATAAFGYLHGVPFRAVPAAEEGASVDNALNMFSTMSLPGWTGPLWAQSGTQLLREISGALWSDDVIAPPGGNNETGALGHVGAFLELCEQVQLGYANPVQHIFLAMGSTCTTSGLIAGAAIARKLGMSTTSEKLTIHAVPIHHVAARPIMKPLLQTVVKKVARDVLRLIADLGGPDATQELDDVLREKMLDIITGFAGKYGAWDDRALLAKATMSAATVSHDAPTPWMCSTFTSKAFAAMLHTLRNMSHIDPSTTMLWCTKSAVQPAGPNDEDLWAESRSMPKSVRNWLVRANVPSEGVFNELWSTTSKL